MRIRFYTAALVLLSALCVFAASQTLRAQDWQPNTPEDLALKENPKSAADSAMILYREVEINDSRGTVREYVRIKILKDTGLKYADAKTMTYPKSWGTLAVCKGRTIHPDGSIVEFSGQPAQQSVSRGRTSNDITHTFSLPAPTVGSIVEYRYTIQSSKDMSKGGGGEGDVGGGGGEEPGLNKYWLISQELFQRKAHFVFTPAEKNNFTTLPSFALQEKITDRTLAGHRQLTLDMENIAAVPVEDSMPPLREVLNRIDFVYFGSEAVLKMDEFWSGKMKRWAGGAQHFMDKPNAVQRALSATVNASDSHEVKMRKIYDKVQSLRNVTYMKPEPGQEKPQSNDAVDDVLSHGYGNHNELNRLFVAMAKAAGLDATLVNLVQRDQAQLHKNYLSMDQFTAEVALVRDNGKLIYLDPGTMFCPYGILPWEDTGVASMVQDKNTAKFDDHNTPLPEPTGATIVRKASFKLLEDGSLDGTLEVTFTGQEALERRLKARKQDDAARQKEMDKQAASWFSAKGDIKMQSANDWKSSSLPLVVTYSVHLPKYVDPSSSSMRLSMLPFGKAYKNPFVPEERVSRIYFRYPYDYADDVTIALPPAFQAGLVPKPASFTNSLSDYTVTATVANGAVQLKRDFKLKGVFVDAKYYPVVKGYFDHVQDADNLQKLSLTKK